MSEEKIDAYTVYATTNYVDEQLNSASSSKLISHVLPIEATEENQTIFPINLETFDAANDTILVQDGITLLLPNSGFTIENNTIVMTTPWGLGDTGSILILKNTPILADEVAISGAVIENNSITLDKLSADITTELDEIKKSASDGKALVAGAITDKGIETAADATFETMANNINSIITLDSVPSLEAAEITPGTGDQIISSGNYLKGDQTIKGDANLVAANIAKGKSVFGVTGTYDPVATLTQTYSVKTVDIRSASAAKSYTLGKLITMVCCKSSDSKYTDPTIGDKRTEMWLVGNCYKNDPGSYGAGDSWTLTTSSSQTIGGGTTTVSGNTITINDTSKYRYYRYHIYYIE